MKVILLQDVAKLGRRFEVVEAPAGYAQNKLIPQGLAEEATPQNLKRIEARKSKQSADQSAVAASFHEALSALEGKTVTVTTAANDQGHLFEAIKPDTIVAALSGIGVTVAEKQVVIETPIKAVGAHEIMLREGDETAVLTIDIVAK